MQRVSDYKNIVQLCFFVVAVVVSVSTEASVIDIRLITLIRLVIIRGATDIFSRPIGA